MRYLLPLLFALLVACNADTSSKERAKSPDVLAAYTLLAPGQAGDTLIYARVILSGVYDANQMCPELAGDDGSRVKTRVRGLHPDAANFPVTVCEAKVSAGTGYRLPDSDFRLAPVNLNPENILVFGDTGCKAGVCPTGTAAVPFAQMAALGAAQHAGLILHMGDYNYRGTSGSIEKDIYAYDAGDGGYGGPSCGLEETYYSQNAAGSTTQDHWQTWYDDFFLPAQSLSASAPWVFARGNHELCSRAGPGWFYFLGPGSSLPGGIAQQACPAQGRLDTPPATAREHIRMAAPYQLRLEKLNLWVMDSANACDDRSGNELTVEFRSQFELLQRLAKASPDKPVWMMTHRPLWGVVNQSTGETLNKMMQTALAQTAEGSLPSQVALSLSGHMHSYQSLTFPAGSKRPPQLVVGDSGVSLSAEFSERDFTAPVDGVEAQGNAEGKFGFLTIQAGRGKAWLGQLLDHEGKAFIRCDSGNPEKGERICQ